MGDHVPFAELLFFAYRDFTADADAILEAYGFGRAHHRVLHFVTRSPGLRIADLLDILKITKQSLARVLRQLVDEGIIVQKAGERDRRERRLYASDTGIALAEKLSRLQAERIESALDIAGPDARETVKAFLFAMIDRGDQKAVEAYLSGSRPMGVAPGTQATEASLPQGTASGDRHGAQGGAAKMKLSDTGTRAPAPNKPMPEERMSKQRLSEEDI